MTAYPQLLQLLLQASRQPGMRMAIKRIEPSVFRTCMLLMQSTDHNKQLTMIKHQSGRSPHFRNRLNENKEQKPAELHRHAMPHNASSHSVASLDLALELRDEGKARDLATRPGVPVYKKFVKLSCKSEQQGVIYPPAENSTEEKFRLDRYN